MHSLISLFFIYNSINVTVIDCNEQNKEIPDNVTYTPKESNILA